MVYLGCRHFQRGADYHQLKIYTERFHWADHNQERLLIHHMVQEDWMEYFLMVAMIRQNEIRTSIIKSTKINGVNQIQIKFLRQCSFHVCKVFVNIVIVNTLFCKIIKVGRLVKVPARWADSYLTENILSQQYLEHRSR